MRNIVRQWGELLSKRWLVVLVGGDLLFIALHIAYKFDLLTRDFNLSRDGNYPEIFQYLKLALISVLLLQRFLRRRSATDLVWCFGFTYLLIDDALQVHENFGPFVASHVAIPFELDLDGSVGELLSTGIFGGLIFLAVAVVYRRANQADRLVSECFGVLMVLLFTCGVVIDAVHTWVIENFHVSAISGPLGVMEDGGEMLVISFACAYTLALSARDVD